MTVKKTKADREALGKGMTELAEENKRMKTKAGNEASEGNEAEAAEAMDALKRRRTGELEACEDRAVVLMAKLTRRSFAETVGDMEALRSALGSLDLLRRLLIAAARAKLDEDVRQAEQGRRAALEELAGIEEENA